MPRWTSAFEARLRAILGRRRADANLDDEMAHHLALQTEET